MKLQQIDFDIKYPRSFKFIYWKNARKFSRRRVITAYLLVFFSSFLSYLVFETCFRANTVLTAEKFIKFIIFVARNSIRKEPDETNSGEPVHSLIREQGSVLPRTGHIN